MVRRSTGSCLGLEQGGGHGNVDYSLHQVLVDVADFLQGFPHACHGITWNGRGRPQSCDSLRERLVGQTSHKAGEESQVSNDMIEGPRANCADVKLQGFFNKLDLREIRKIRMMGPEVMQDPACHPGTERAVLEMARKAVGPAGSSRGCPLPYLHPQLPGRARGPGQRC